MGHYVAGSVAMRLLELAERHRGEFVSQADATSILFPNGKGTAAARKRVYAAVYHLAKTGRLRRRRGEFALALDPPPVASLRCSLKAVATKKLTHVRNSREAEADEQPRPTGRAAVRDGLNRLQHLRNEFVRVYDELVSEVHRANGSAAVCSDDLGGPAGYPMRCATSEEWESNRD